MRIVGWAEFQKLPEGTIFQEFGGNDGYLGNPMILGDVWMHQGGGGDFLEASLLPSIASTNQLDDESLAHMGLSEGGYAELVLTPDGFGRDGVFDYDRKWLIWEAADRERLAGWLLDPAAALGQMNDPAHAFVLISGPTQ